MSYSLTRIVITLRSAIWGQELDQEMLAKETETLLATVDHYERLLSKQRYIAGDVSLSLI